jgi:stage II sporulation protein R
MKKSKITCIFILFLLLFSYIFLCAFSYVQAVSQDISNSVFRLHVIANSDSEEDQALKLTVRDSLLNYMNEICANCTTKEEAILIVNENKDNFEQIALNTIYEQGYAYSVNINIGSFEFPTKTYGDISLPAGIYDALRVEIGEAKGQNWWCVMFPPLCFVDVSSGIVSDNSKQLLKDELSSEEFTLISDNSSSGINFKFKLLEFFSNSGLLTGYWIMD